MQLKQLANNTLIYISTRTSIPFPCLKQGCIKYGLFPADGHQSIASLDCRLDVLFHLPSEVDNGLHIAAQSSDAQHHIDSLVHAATGHLAGQVAKLVIGQYLGQARTYFSIDCKLTERGTFCMLDWNEMHAFLSGR